MILPILNPPPDARGPLGAMGLLARPSEGWAALLPFPAPTGPEAPAAAAAGPEGWYAPGALSYRHPYRPPAGAWA